MLVAQRGLTGAAAGALTAIVRDLPLDALAPVKQLLKQFFSAQPWTERDDDALADIVGAGAGSHHLALDRGLTLDWGWPDGRFLLRVRHDGVEPEPESELGLTFDADVAPEVTPNPRTIRFATPPLHTGASRVYDSVSDAAGDPRAARVFEEFDAVTNVLVGPSFVAVTISRPDQWEALLGPMLRTITEEFTGVAADSSESVASGPTAASAPPVRESSRAPRRLERAWADLRKLRGDRPDDLERIVAATRDADPSHRQVAAALLSDAPAETASAGWSRLLGDENRSVRRSVVDAVVDARREALRPLLERALADPDAWTRWKAVHGIAALGAAPSRAAIASLAADPDFRVRLEAARALA
jgi:hypothetical protein